MTSTLTIWIPRLALPLCALALNFTSFGCKAKEKRGPATTAAEQTTTEVLAAPKAKPKSVHEAASEADRALARDFIVRFTKIIEVSKSDGWLELLSTAQRENSWLKVPSSKPMPPGWWGQLRSWRRFAVASSGSRNCPKVSSC
jgi:hypothetical protein